MPHIVLNQSIDLLRFQKSFKEIFQKEPILIKVQNLYLDKFERTALLPTTVIESKNQHFLIEVNAKDEKTTIRLFPGTDPEKTPGVKMSLGLISNNLMKLFSDAKIVKTNIQEFIPELK